MTAKHGLVVLVFAVAACGDDSSSNECGPNTTEQDGVCVPTITCGPGTVADETGTCIPDGSVVCSDGTMFDVASGTCVPSMDVCGDGTVLVDGVCRDPATVTPDATEAPEVNESSPTGAGTITVPDIGADGFVIHGCITPHDSGETADLDPWVITVSQPTVLEISADGLGGLAAGFALFNADGDPALADYQRFGLNSLTDSAKRQAYLPLAGTYALVMADQRTILGLGAAGNEASCYYTTVKQVALPTPVALTLPTTTGADTGNVQVFRFTSAADGTIFKATMSESSSVLDPAWVALRNDAFVGLATEQGGNSDGQPTRYVGAVDNTQSADIVVDMEFNSAVAPQPFQIDAYTIAASALPTAGGTVTVTKQNGVNPADPIVESNGAVFRNLNYYYFDVAAADDVVHFDLSATESALFAVLRTDIVENETGGIDGLAFIDENAPTPLAFTDQFIRFLQPGRYYVAVFQAAGTANDTYSLTSTLTPQSAAAVMVGDTLTAQAISDVTGSAWREFAPGTAKWVEMTGAGANLGTAGDLEVLYYPASFEGWLDNGSAPNGPIPSDPNFDQTFAADGSTGALGRVTLNFPLEPFLVRFRSSAGPAAGQTFDYSIASRTFTDLGNVTEAAPIAMGVQIPASSRVRFLVQSPGRVSIALTNTDFDAAIHWLLYDEQVLFTRNAVTGAGDETLNNLPTFGLDYVAFEVENLGATAGTMDLGITTLIAAPFVEICPAAGGNGTELVGFTDDAVTATQTLPFSFSFFGTSVNMYKVSTNGWLTFDPSVTAPFATPPATFPSAGAPNGVLAPYWDDLLVDVCRRDEANRTVIEWSGFSFSTFAAVQFQVSIYNTNNRIEFAYGPDHASDGELAAAGLENLAGTVGFELFNDEPGAVRPSYGEVFLLP